MNFKRLLRTPVGLLLALLADFALFGGPHRPDTVFRADFAAALNAQAEVSDQWLSMQGVVGTAVGLDLSGQAVLKVYLESPAVAVLPGLVSGVPVHLEVTGPIVALGDPPEGADVRAGAVNPAGGFPRPVPIGVSGGHPGVTAGTIGARVTDGSRVFALSNNHVFANNNTASPGDPMLQPGVADGGRNPDDGFATLHDFEPIQFCSGVMCPSNSIDAAIALTTLDDLGTETPEGGYGQPKSSPIEAKLNQAVQKFGRTTGYTHGRVTGVNATINVNYRTGLARFDGQIMITGDGFSAGGDSGSLIVTEGVLLGDRRPLGLLFAGSANNTIANPIELVLDRFGVRVDGG